jgi:integrating conjugative element protein (TIGR03756 family)
MIRVRAMAAVLVTALAVRVPLAQAAPGDTTTTPALVSQAMSSALQCGQWHVSGICFFLVCTMFGCKIKTSTRYSHMNPDAVVSTYHDTASHPWPMIGIPLATAAAPVGSSILGGLFDNAGARTRFGHTPKTNRTDRMRIFKDGDVIGHPAAGMGFFPVSCPSGVSAFQPYYQSVLDTYVWRGILPVELLHPAAWLPGLREVGTGGTNLINTWGNVYPRTGETTQQHPVKGAAVLSQRIADFTTRRGEPHVYTQLPSGGTTSRNGYQVFDPPPAQENVMIGGLWQLSAPMVSAAAASCTVFGYADLGPLSYGDYSTSGSMSYAFTLWRPYACCRKRGSFLFDIRWGMW